MSENEALASALVKFQRWCKDGGPLLYGQIEIQKVQIAALAEENAKLKTAIANLPAAGDERWEKLRTFIEIYRPSCGDTEYAVALQNACDAIDNEHFRLASLHGPETPDSAQAYVVWDLTGKQWHFYASDLPPAPTGGRHG